jgi:hypothetical protein
VTGTPADIAALLSAGDRIECGIDGVGTLKVTIGNPEQAAGPSVPRTLRSAQAVRC